jgi:hypothetical protein
MTFVKQPPRQLFGLSGRSFSPLNARRAFSFSLPLTSQPFSRSSQCDALFVDRSSFDECEICPNPPSAPKTDVPPSGDG